MIANLAAQSEADREELRERIKWLIRLRWLAILAVLATIGLAPFLGGVTLAQRPLLWTTAGLAAYNLCAAALSRWVSLLGVGPGPAYFANAQISADLVFLTALLHFSGGIENPFVCYYVFHVVIASILLSRTATYVQATLAVGLLAIMGVLEAGGVVPHYHLSGLLPASLYRNPRYVFAVLFALGSMLYLAAFLGTSIALRLRRREAEIIHLTEGLREYAEDQADGYASLQRLEKEKSDFLHRAAHHLRSPLATLERMLSVVVEGRAGALPPTTQEMLERARSRARSMQELTRDLLVLSRARQAAVPTAQQQVDLASLLHSIEADFQHPAARREVSLAVSCPPGPVQIPGNPESLYDLLENLVANAVRYTPPGGAVRVELRRANGTVEIVVSDTGIGIPAQEQQQVFDEFYRASNARESEKEGTGLGLAIVKTVAEAHGGSVLLESKLGVGTTFTVRLPWSPPREAPPA